MKIFHNWKKKFQRPEKSKSYVVSHNQTDHLKNFIQSVDQDDQITAMSPADLKFLKIDASPTSKQKIFKNKSTEDAQKLGQNFGSIDPSKETQASVSGLKNGMQVVNFKSQTTSIFKQSSLKIKKTLRGIYPRDSNKSESHFDVKVTKLLSYKVTSNKSLNQLIDEYGQQEEENIKNSSSKGSENLSSSTYHTMQSTPPLSRGP